MKMRLIAGIGAILWTLATLPPAVAGGVINRVATREKCVALTFDACETKTPSWLDKTILDYIEKERIPCSIFVSGKFAVRNRSELQRISRLEFIRLENHSLNHFQHMEKLSDEVQKKEILEAEKILVETAGRKPIFFRFPAGNHDANALHIAESLGYRVVHWTFPSGDPDRGETAPKLTRWVVSKASPGSILIFHINGRGYHTGEALPGIVHELKGKGYRFVSLEELFDSAKVGP